MAGNCAPAHAGAITTYHPNHMSVPSIKSTKAKAKPIFASMHSHPVSPPIHCGFKEWHIQISTHPLTPENWLGWCVEDIFQHLDVG